MLIIRGVNVFPSQIEEALLRVEGTAPHYLIEVARPGTLDQVTVTVELRPEVFTTDEQRLRYLQRQVSREIQTVAGIRAAVILLGPHSLERSTGKAKRVVDHRKIVDRG
jgi:phenylacetate-CoA ligase